MRIEYHRTMTADGVRNAAFHAALKSVIKPGLSVVADIGAGTGLLGLMASKLGAQAVFLYETAEVGGLAFEIIKKNKAKNCLLLPCHSTEMEKPPKVDVVVSETLGNYPLEEDIIAMMRDARKRHLKPGGTIIPRRIEQYISPVSSPRFHEELTTWGSVGYDIDYSIAQTMTFHNIYVRRVLTSDLLDAGRATAMWDEFDLMGSPSTTRRGEVSFKISKPATVYGFAIWWAAELVPGNMLSTAPDAPQTHWEQLYLPLMAPIAAQAGQQVDVVLRSRTTNRDGTVLDWTATHLDRAGKQVSKQSLDISKGYLP
jgi:hypothetical protein